MYKKNAALILIMSIIFIELFNTLNIYSEYSRPKNSDKDEVLIVYDERSDLDGKSDLVNILENLLYSYDVKVKYININDYKEEKNMLNLFSYVFILATEDDFYNKNLLDDLLNYTGKICWLGNGIDKLLNVKDFNLEYKGKSNNIVKLEYKGNEFPVYNNGTFNLLEPSIQKDIIIRSTIKDDLGEYPYIVESNNLTYVSQIEFEDIYFYILCDALNDVFGINRSNNNKVLLDITDINYYSDPIKLKNIADYLYLKDIKYIISVTAFIKNSNNGVEVDIFDNKEVIETIKYMEDHGATIALDLNSQGHEKFNDLNKYDFWDKSDNDVEEVIVETLDMYLKNGIHPVALKVSNNVVDSMSYNVFKKYFSTFIGLYQNNNRKVNSTFYPYQIMGSTNFNKLISQNTNKINTKDKLCFEKIGYELDKLSIVDGYSISYEFNSYLGKNYLEKLLDLIDNRDIRYRDLKSEDNWIKVNELTITSKDGNITTNYRKNMNVEENKKVEQANIYNTISTAGVIFSRIIEVTLIIFVLVFIIFKKIDKNKFFRS